MQIAVAARSTSPLTLARTRSSPSSLTALPAGVLSGSSAASRSWAMGRGGAVLVEATFPHEVAAFTVHRSYGRPGVIASRISGVISWPASQ
jgi:hypothetical protein